MLEHTAEHGYSCHSRSRPVYKSPCASGNIQTYPNWKFFSPLARDWSFLAQDSRIVRTISSRCSSMGMTCTVGKDDRIHGSNLNPGRSSMWSPACQGYTDPRLHLPIRTRKWLLHSSGNNSLASKFKNSKKQQTSVAVKF